MTESSDQQSTTPTTNPQPDVSNTSNTSNPPPVAPAGYNAYSQQYAQQYSQQYAHQWAQYNQSMNSNPYGSYYNQYPQYSYSPQYAAYYHPPNAMQTTVPTGSTASTGSTQANYPPATGYTQSAAAPVSFGWKHKPNNPPPPPPKSKIDHIKPSNPVSREVEWKEKVCDPFVLHSLRNCGFIDW